MGLLLIIIMVAVFVGMILYYRKTNEEPKEKQSSILYPCPDCGKEISKNAEKCPHCGKIIYKPVNISGVILGILLIIIGLAIFWGISFDFTVELM